MTPNAHVLNLAEEPEIVAHGAGKLSAILVGPLGLGFLGPCRCEIGWGLHPDFAVCQESSK